MTAGGIANRDMPHRARSNMHDDLEQAIYARSTKLALEYLCGPWGRPELDLPVEHVRTENYEYASWDFGVEPSYGRMNTMYDMDPLDPVWARLFK